MSPRTTLRAVALALALGTPAVSAAALTPATTPLQPRTTTVRADDPPQDDVPQAAREAHEQGRPVGGDMLGRPGVLVDAPSGVPAPPALDAGAYIVADIDSGKVVLAKNVHAPSLPASTMKAVTALAVVPHLPAEKLFTAQYEDAAVDGTKVGIMPGSQYSVGQCVQALLLASANDCAVALARVNGGLAATTQQMNAKLRSLGALDTTAKNTSGLDAVGQVASAYDLALVGRAAVRDAHVAPYLTIKSTTFPAGAAQAGHARATFGIGSHNRLLWNYDGAIGVKNGYTIKARHTYIGAARRGKKAYVIAFLNSSTGNWRAQAALLDWAFANGDKVGGLGTLVDPVAAPGESDSGSTQVSAGPARAVDAISNASVTPVKVVGGLAVVAALAVVALRARVLVRRRRRRLKRSGATRR